MLQNGDRNIRLQQDTLKIELDSSIVPANYSSLDSISLKNNSVADDTLQQATNDSIIFLNENNLRTENNSDSAQLNIVNEVISVRPRIIRKPKPKYDQDTIPYIISDQNKSQWKFLEEIPITKPEDAKNQDKQFIVPISKKNRLEFHKLKIGTTETKVNIAPIERVFSHTSDWLLGVIILSFILLAWSKMLYGKYLNPLISGVFNYQLAHKLYRDKNISLQKVSINLNLIYILNLSLFLFVLLDYKGVYLTSVKIYDFFLCFVFIYILFIIKYILFYLVGYLFLVGNEFSEYYYHTSLLNKVLGLFLLPLIPAAAYAIGKISLIFIFFGVGLIIFFYLIRILKGFRIFMKKDISIFYMFLYLCALEIFPLMIFYKYISIYLNEAI